MRHLSKSFFAFNSHRKHLRELSCDFLVLNKSIRTLWTKTTLIVWCRWPESVKKRFVINFCLSARNLCRVCSFLKVVDQLSANYLNLGVH